MHHASENKKRESKNPQVSVRLNVRPICWKAVKQYESNGERAPIKGTASPAEDQLNGAVWKTKNVRTDIVKSIAIETGEEPKKSDKHHHLMGTKLESTVGVLPKCDCASCEKADDTVTTRDIEWKGTKDDWHLKGEQSQGKKKRGKSSSKQHGRRRRRHRSHASARTRSLSTPPPVPPNSVMSYESQKQWIKLYDEACHPSKPIDFKKMPISQIGMSELQPEDPPSPPPTAREPEDVAPTRTPHPPHKKPPPISQPSNAPELLFNVSSPTQPPLVPQPPTQPQSNIVILPAPVDNPPVVKQEKKNNNAPLGKSIPPGSDSNSSLIFMPASSPTTHQNALSSNSNVSMIRKMENLFYSSESNWWFLVALIMLTIVAYRSSIEQHTCYYD